MTTIPADLFRTLLELTEDAADLRAEALREAFDCASVTALLLRLVRAEDAESRELQRQIQDVLQASDRRG